MTRSSRPSARAAELDLVRSGEMTVGVARPRVDGLPKDLKSRWTSAGERPQWITPYAPSQPVRVSYQVFSDPLQLADLVERARRNKSGEAIRGYAVATTAGARLVISEQAYGALVTAAANAKNGRTVDGPVRVRAKLLEQPEPYVPVCGRKECRQPLEAHERVEVEMPGDYTADGRWDPSLTRIDARYYCPEAS